MGSTKKHKDKERGRSKERTKLKEHKKKHRSRSPRHVVEQLSSSPPLVDLTRSTKDKTKLKVRSHSHKKKHKDKSKRKRSGSAEDSDVPITKSARHAAEPSTEPPHGVSPSSPIRHSGGGDSSLSIEETNKLRIKLGLKPLQVDSGPSSRPRPTPSTAPKEEEENGEDMDEETLNRIKAERESEGQTFWKETKEFVHVPAENIGKQREAEKIRDRIQNQREKRRLEDKLLTTKGLADSDDEGNAAIWVEKSKKIAAEKALAAKRARALEDLDEQFGVGELVANEYQRIKNNVYGSRDLKGIKVMHARERIDEGVSVIMTLKDKGVLEDEDDVLVNVNMVDDEKFEKNVSDRKLRPELHGYNAFEDASFDDYGNLKQVGVLSKYDEEIKGIEKKAFVIGEDTSSAARMAKIREKMQKADKILDSIEAPALQLASDFYTEEEMTFRKTRKKVRRSRKVFKADDLLRLGLPDVSGHKDLGSRKRKETAPDPNVKFKGEVVDMKIDMEIDDLPPAPQVVNVSDVRIEDEGDLDFQLALSKARKLKQKQKASKQTLEAMADMLHLENRDEKQEGGGSIVLHATAEFCRTLGDIPSVDGANLYGDEEMDFETEERKASREELEERGKWNAVEIDEAPVDITREPDLEKAPILEQEPEVGPGIAGALKLAMKKGYLEYEKLKPSAAPKMKHLQAKNYSIEDKNYEDDRAPSKRDMYSGPTTDFKEKGNYKPDFKLEYIDEEGKPIPAKEAFRLLSHKFHGKGSGKNKIDKKRRKFQQEKLMQHMNSTDTPLGTLELLQQRQKTTHMPYIVMSGSKASQNTALSKPAKR